MLKDGKILLGKAEEKDVYIVPSQMNRHGLITGASGTGKTVTLKVIAEALSEIGVPTVIADVKGDNVGVLHIKVFTFVKLVYAIIYQVLMFDK